MRSPDRVLALALTVVLASSCAALKDIAASAARPRASAKSAKDIAACEKMCEVAGNAESNAAAVDRCKADCRE
ncbi:MAG: hypothetical protein FJ137_04260 [Deltaproteobacteria bacterium]|nr:hypothetical protein [Deltaproteobacteria bacterium]